MSVSDEVPSTVLLDLIIIVKNRGTSPVHCSLLELFFKISFSAIANPFDIEESTVEELRVTMNVNLMAHFWTIRALLPHLRKSQMFNGK